MFEFVELDFDEIVDGLDVRLPCVGAWWYGGVGLAGDVLDGCGIGARVFGEDAADVLGAVVGLASGF